MRWAHTPRPRHGDTRIRRGFLIIPRLMNGEWRWMEYAVWEQSFHDGIRAAWWTDQRWIEEQQPARPGAHL